ncbi:hypothetical protein NUM3379_29960 [Kineococcus sp. NUM-3379]
MTAAVPAAVPGAAAGPEPRVLHVNDCASTTVQLVAEAHRRDLPWEYLPLAGRGRRWTGLRGRAAQVGAGARWAARLGAGAARADLLHVHYASVVRHTAWTRRRYVLHVHGTDVRSQQYEPRWTAPVRAALRGAVAVYFSTPDLAGHVLPHRPGARYLPVPLDLTAIPPWRPQARERPRVLFTSRWEPVKGGAEQLALARALRAALPAEVELAGLDWGPGAGEAAAAGVRLLPRTDRAGFLRLLASATLAVGQSSGMLAASELEAVGTGVPLAAALRPDWYPASAPDGNPAVLAGTAGWEPSPAARVEAVVEAVRDALADPPAASARLAGPGWLARSHDVRAAVERLRADYRELRA